MNEELPDFDINEVLSESEIESLASINQKIYKHLEDKYKEKRFDHLDNDNPIDFADKHPDILHREHITDCPHEMRITLDVKISSIDEKGNLKEVKDLYLKYFHIPIPSQTDYVKTAEKFFEKFETKLYETCNENIKPIFKDVAKQ
jgi:hypothetical protein